MQISFIYILMTAELILILLGLSITLAIVLFRRSQDTTETESNNSESQLDAINLGESYIDFLEQMLERNTNKLVQEHKIEEHDEADDSESLNEGEEAENLEEENTTETTDDNSNDNTIASSAPNEKQSNLLLARERFLNCEKDAEQHAHQDANYWQHIYDGMDSIIKQFSDSKTISENNNTEEVKTKSKETVFYIEAQGKKIDGEVNKLKDIIADQENALSSMQKALANAPETEDEETSAAIATLREQMMVLESQVNDSKMCMEVLEMENDRLQAEVDQMEARHNSLFESDSKTPDTTSDEGDEDSGINMDEIRDLLEQQEARIKQLLDTIEQLEITVEQADEMKSSLSDFAQTSKEMMGCICILEDENSRLLSEAESGSDAVDEASGDSDGIAAELETKISTLEEELIKKDVAYAKLQDEFSSMETEYLAMYEAMHGDNS